MFFTWVLEHKVLFTRVSVFPTDIILTQSAKQRITRRVQVVLKLCLLGEVTSFVFFYFFFADFDSVSHVCRFGMVAQFGRGLGVSVK